MESLALAAAIVMLVVYGSGILALILSWSRLRVFRIASYCCAAFATASGIWLAVMLRDGNGIMLAFVPLLTAGAAVINLRRRR
jgi:hypothetical protein